VDEIALIWDTIGHYACADRPISMYETRNFLPTVSQASDILVQLRDSVRAVVLADCGEPDLGELIKPIQLTAESTT
jgi:hypothetical protein